MVVNPADIPTSNKETAEKADPIDSRKIAKALGGGMLRGIHVPSTDAQGDCHLFRYRKRLWTDLVRLKNRIKDKLLFCGVQLPPKYDNSFWTKEFLAWLEKVSLPALKEFQVNT